MSTAPQSALKKAFFDIIDPPRFLLADRADL
jgi:hypothetical protein